MKNDKEEFDFIKEKIKDKPINKGKLAMKVGGVVALAIIFGAVACSTFYLVKPWASEVFEPDETHDPVVLSKESDSDSQHDETEETQPKPIETEPPKEQVVEVAEPTIKDYKKILDQMEEVANQARRAMVSVTGISSATDIFNQENETAGTAAGLVVYDNGQYIYILVEQKVLINTIQIDVTFSDETKVENLSINDVTVDNSTGLAVLRVPVSSIGAETYEGLTKDLMSNKRAVCNLGEPIIAVGNPSGKNSVIQYGFIISEGTTFNDVENSNVEKYSTYDIEYDLIHTDMVGTGGSGILIDLEGSVVGFISQRFTPASSNNITAFDINGILKLIENLSNNPNIAYLGIKGMDVSDERSEGEGIPKGLYINNVAEESPAFSVGLRNGDVIVEIDGQPITGNEDFVQIMESKKSGESLTIYVKRPGGENEGYVDIENPFVVELGVL